MSKGKQSAKTSNFVIRVSNEDKKMFQQLANDMKVKSVSKAIRKVVQMQVKKGTK